MTSESIAWRAVSITAPDDRAVGGLLDEGPGLGPRSAGLLRFGKAGLIGGLTTDVVTKGLETVIPECRPGQECD